MRKPLNPLLALPVAQELAALLRDQPVVRAPYQAAARTGRAGGSTGRMVLATTEGAGRATSAAMQRRP
jgi:hypothetical protein